MRKIILGGHWCELEGWEIYTEEQIDITKPLPFDDGSIDFIFTEHVIEHVYFHQGVSFLREANRVLKSGGKIRTVCPFIDVIISTDLDNDNGKEYIKTQILPICFGKQYKDALDDIGIQYEKHAQVFSLLNQYHCFSHKFMWTTSLMKDVMSNIGFQDVTRRDPRCGDNTSLCVERPKRGVTSDSVDTYDCEGCAIEGAK